MDQKEIRALLERFYSGESTLHEENILREYFSGDQVDPEFTADQDLFLYQIQKVKDKQEIPDISNEIWNSLIKEDAHKNKAVRSLPYLYLRIAASVVILVGSFFIIKNQVFDTMNTIQYTDTFDNPELAYQQTKETLLYVSAMLNSGAEHLEPIQKINEGTQPLNKLATFNQGLKELKPITNYSKADKYLK